MARIAPAAKATRRPGADADLGGFGGLFDLKAAGFKDPVLVASTDGVGTKLKIAIETGLFDGIGQDLVAMCVNDIVVQGAEPLFFLDYYATGKLDVEAAAVVIEGIARACKEAGCALIGGETAEMPGLYAKGDFDLAGFCGRRGGARRRPAQDATTMRAGDVLIGVASSRRAFQRLFAGAQAWWSRAALACDAPAPFAARQTLGEALLTPTRLYVKSALAAIRSRRREGPGPYHRRRHHRQSAALPARRAGRRGRSGGLDAAAGVRLAGASPPASPQREMLRTFNCGIGLIAVADEDDAGHVIDAFQEAATRRCASARWSRGDGEAKVVYRGALKL